MPVATPRANAAGDALMTVSANPPVNATNGMTQPFDLLAEGGPDNVWIVEVGTVDEQSFDDFVTAVTADEPVVEGA